MAITHETPTKEQPVQNPSINKPESGRPTTMEWVRKHKGAVIGIGGAAAGAAVTAALMSGEKGGNEPAPEATPIVTSQPTPEESVQPTTEPSPEVSPTNIPEQNGDSTEVLVQTTSLEAMQALPTEELVKLGYPDRAAYTILTLLDIGFTEDEFMTEGDEWVLRDPGLLIGDWNEFRMEAFNHPDPDVRAKLLAGLYYYTTSQQTGEITDSYRQVSTDFVTMGAESSARLGNQFHYIDSGELQSGTDRSGNPIDYINVTYQLTDDATGDPEGPVTTAQAIRTVIQLEDGRKFIMYPQGYEIEGQISPVEGADY